MTLSINQYKENKERIKNTIDTNTNVPQYVHKKFIQYI